jgi:hypothetical protein
LAFRLAVHPGVDAQRAQREGKEQAAAPGQGDQHVGRGGLAEYQRALANSSMVRMLDL